MQTDSYVFMADHIAKFFNTIRIAGWFHHPTDGLADVRLHDPRVTAAIAAVAQPHEGVAALGPDKGFTLQVMRSTEGFDDQAELEFITRDGWRHRVKLADLAAERLGNHATPDLLHRFQAAMHAEPGARILDIGGRSRSGLARRDLFDVGEYTVLDVLPDPSVDVVGDAHALAALFPADHFDGIVSVSVFEHLMMPWAVATQMNHVLKRGGLALIYTHQTLGMHDAPWDFWRYSDTAWDSLFNRHTGFEILARALDGEQFVVPFIQTPNKIHAERAAGYEGSAVLVRKIGPCLMTWPLVAADVAPSMYPED